jgi:hypothetical protein
VSDRSVVIESLQSVEARHQFWRSSPLKRPRPSLIVPKARLELTGAAGLSLQPNPVRPIAIRSQSHFHIRKSRQAECHRIAIVFRLCLGQLFANRALPIVLRGCLKSILWHGQAPIVVETRGLSILSKSITESYRVAILAFQTSSEDSGLQRHAKQDVQARTKTDPRPMKTHKPVRKCTEMVGANPSA